MSDATKPVEKTQEGAENETDAPKTDNEHQRKINVGNLPADITEKQLRDHFSGAEIERVDIYHYRKYTLALLLFKEKEAAAKAVEEKEHSTLRGRRIRVHLEYLTIRHIKREVIVTVLDDENTTEDQLWDKVKAAGVELTSVLVFYPLGYISLEKEADKAAVLEKLNAAGFSAYDVNQRDQNQHLDIWRAAKLFFRNRNRVQLLNIPTKWLEDKEEMKKQCAEGGVITEAVSNNVNQSSSNYARVFYETEEQAVKAAAALNGKVFEGKRIHALHLGSALIPNYKTSVYVTSLEKTVTEENVFDHFKQFGDVDFVNRRNCNDAAIVCFKSADSVEKAIACTTFPAPTEADKNATTTITVKKYDGPLLLRALALKRKLKTNDDGTPVDPEEKTKEMQDVLKKLQAFHPVFVGNVPLNCPPLELKRYFAQHGPIKFMFSPQIVTYQQSAPHPVKTFIIYYNFRPSALNACKFLDHKFFGGHRLHVLPLRGELSFDVKKTVKVTKIPYLSEDALFKKVKPYVGKINRIVKKTRMAAFIELNDLADVDKLMDVDAADHPLNKAKMETITANTSVRLYDENDTRVLRGIAKIIAKNPDMLKKVAPGQLNKRPRMNGPGTFNQGPGGFNPSNNMNNPQAIQDLLRLAFMSGKNVGESLATGQGSFNAPDPPLANSNNFGDGGFRGNNNRGGNQMGGGQSNFRPNNRNNMNNNQNNQNRPNTNNFNAGGNNFQGNANANRGNQGNMMNRQNQGQNNQNRVQGQGGVQPKPNVGGNLNLNNQNRVQGGNNMNVRNTSQTRNQNQGNRNNFSSDDNSFGTGGGGGNFNARSNNNFSNNDFSNDDSFGDTSNDGGNSFGNQRNFNNRNNQNDNFGGNFGNSGNNRFQNNAGNNSFGNNFNRNRFSDNDNSDNVGGGGGFNKNFQNRKQFGGNNNQGGGGGMSFGEFNSNTNRNFGNNGGNNGGGFNKWNNNSNNSGQNSNNQTGGRLAGTIFSRRF
uniref:Putative serine/threonine-protein kinase clka n=1 Tax=Culex tarsalis TaxID=7177 RepID=A0A1Q3EY23_CULTA